MSHKFLIDLAVLSFGAQSGLAQNTPAASSQTKRDPRLLTVTGCLQRGADANTFLLTKVPDPLVDAVAASGGGAVVTVTYQLSGGQNLAPHVGHKIEVTGRGPLKDQTPVKIADTETKYAPAGTAGKDTPKAEVKEKAAVAVRPLAVESFKMVSTDCAGK
jgi:hypothetical protein